MQTLATVADYCRIIKSLARGNAHMLSEERREHFGRVYAVRIDKRGLRLYYTLEMKHGSHSASVVWRCHSTVAWLVVKALSDQLELAGRDVTSSGFGLLLTDFSARPAMTDDERFFAMADAVGNVSFVW
jgi:hypothetical protein